MGGSLLTEDTTVQSPRIETRVQSSKMQKQLKTKLTATDSELRAQILRMAYAGSSVHIACAFSMVETVGALLESAMNLGSGPNDPDRDRIFMSKGHGVMALYAAYADLGWIEPEWLTRYFSDGSHLHGLSEVRLPILEVSSGSLGHGLPVAVGYAFELKRAKRPGHIYCLVGDGEMNEGPMWESMLFAAHHQLDNLSVIVDANQFQAMGRIEDVIGMESFVQKFKAFGFAADECDGHQRESIISALNRVRLPGQPRALVARTIKGKGVSFMEGRNEWHYSRLTPELFDRAINELKNPKAAR